MKSRTLALFAISGFAIAGIAGSFAVAKRIVDRSGPPVASVDRDFQRVVADSGSGEVTALYQVRNLGGSDLTFGEASTSCGCSVASIEPSVVAAGSMATVRVVGHPPGSGEKRVSISIHTNDPARPLLTLGLAMAGTMPMPYITRSTGAIQFGVLAGRPKPESLVVETCEEAGSPRWLGRATSSLPGAIVSGGFEEARPFAGDAEYRRYRYQVALDPPSTPGPFSGEILVESRGSTVALRVAVRGSVPNPITITPQALIASLDSDTGAESFRIAISSDREDPPLEIHLERDPGSSLEVREVSRTSNRIIFEIKPASQVWASLAESLRFRTNHPKSPEVTLPVELKVSTRR